MAKKKVAKNKFVGSGFDDFLREDAQLEETTAVAMKRVIAWKISQAMKEQKITKKGLAERMHTSRSQVDRILDENDPALTLESLSKAASALGRRVRVELTT
ncbi:MAG TPA: helix-turn-helix transcriptional regulator [Steroidobacteraceae bacterium]|nr:helix-turn-helix transcriptional regulator [Steroidobacteraceae bacterium]